MGSVSTIVQWSGGSQVKWIPTTLQRIGRNELFLEDVLAADPELLGFRSRVTGMQGPYRVFRQRPLPTPTGRTVYPDIVLLAASGHVVIVEVKLNGNPELKERSVIAQIVDYASSFAALSDNDLVTIFRAPESIAPDWFSLVHELYPDEPDVEELASLLRTRLSDGEVHLAIACDRIPPGLTDMVAGIASQSALAFGLEVVEVVPYVQSTDDARQIIFVPTTRLETEIVSRTAVTVRYRTGDERPSVEVKTSSIVEIEETLQLAQEKVSRTQSRPLSDDEFLEKLQAHAPDVVEFAKWTLKRAKESGFMLESAIWGPIIRCVDERTARKFTLGQLTYRGQLETLASLPNECRKSGLDDTVWQSYWTGLKKLIPQLREVQSTGKTSYPDLIYDGGPTPKAKPPLSALINYREEWLDLMRATADKIRDELLNLDRNP